MNWKTEIKKGKRTDEYGRQGRDRRRPVDTPFNPFGFKSEQKKTDERLNTTVEKLKDVVEYVESVEYADELMPFYSSEKVKDFLHQAIKAVEKEIESNSGTD